MALSVVGRRIDRRRRDAGGRPWFFICYAFAGPAMLAGLFWTSHLKVSGLTYASLGLVVLGGVGAALDGLRKKAAIRHQDEGPTSGTR